MEIDKLELIGENLLVGIGYGDSLGLPVETKSHETIKQQFGRLDRLQPVANPFYGNGEAGSYSDDTQLSLAVAKSLIESTGFNMESMVSAHVKALAETPTRKWRGNPVPRGWGKSTWESVMRLKEDPNCYRSSGNPTGEGNGVLMKIAPLALWQCLKPTEYDFYQVEQLAKMTHANALSVVTALVHRDIIRSIFREEVQSSDVANLAEGFARQYEQEYKKAGVKTSQLLGRLASLEDISIEAILEVAPGGGFQSSETLVMAYGAFMRSATYPASVIEAVNLGGDTDSIGSIVAAMSLIGDPSAQHPEDIHLLQDRQHLSKVGTMLIQVSQV
jgi:ADP-ribosyl-[dinitrogen reductase] hydrolase